MKRSTPNNFIENSVHLYESERAEASLMAHLLFYFIFQIILYFILKIKRLMRIIFYRKGKEGRLCEGVEEE